MFLESINTFTQKAIFLSLALFLVYISAFGASVGMNMSTDGAMNGCMLMPHETTLCDMSLLDHLAQWQSTFVSITENAFTLILLTLLALFDFAATTTPFWKTLIPLFVFSVPHTINIKLRNSFAKLYNPLQQAYADGLLNPRLYN